MKGQAIESRSVRTQQAQEDLANTQASNSDGQYVRIRLKQYNSLTLCHCCDVWFRMTCVFFPCVYRLVYSLKYKGHDHVPQGFRFTLECR